MWFNSDMKILLGADHRGFALKQTLLQYLQSQDVEVEDMGAYTLDSTDDFPDPTQKVAERVANGIDVLGIVLCGSGVGVDIAANKVDGVRCALALNPEQVASSRRDDNVNVLALAADHMTEDQAIDAVRTFMETPYEPTEARERRLDKIETIEDEY